MSTRQSGRAPWAERLEKILAREGNDKCGDCDTPNPRWVSSNVGSIVCIRCSGIHRSLGTHISRIRSVELDDWSDEQIQFLDRKGNKRVNIIYEANVPPAVKKITAQSSFEEATSFIKAKYNGNFKSAAANGWKGATVAQDATDDEKKAPSSAVRPVDASPESDPSRRRTLFLKNALSARNQALADSQTVGTDSEDDSEGAADSRRVSAEDVVIKGRAGLKSSLSSSGEFGSDAATEVWNTLEQTGVGSDLKRMQMEERKRMMNEAKQKKEAKKKEEKERKKKEDEEVKRRKKDDKKQRRKSWWRGRAMDGEAIALKHEMEQMMMQGQSDFAYSGTSEDELKNKRENDHRKVRERMRIYEEVKRQQRGQTAETTCPHCHSHIPLPSHLQLHDHRPQTRLELDVSAE